VTEKRERPKGCDEENCEMIVCSDLNYDPEEPHTAWCFGARTGVITGKEKGIENVPSDIFVTCHLIGSHSEACGRHTFICNIPDFYLQWWMESRALYKAGFLKRVIRSFFNVGSDPVVGVFEEEIKRYRKQRVVKGESDIGQKFIEFSCSCKEVFFREYNDEQEDGKYYTPDEFDEKLFEYHRRLGHIIYYKKAKRVKKSRTGNNRFWQIWGPREWKPRKL